MKASQSPPEANGSETLEWTVFLLGQHPWRGVFAGAIAVFMVWFAYSFSGSAWLGGLAAFVMLASLSSFFVPTQYRLDDQGIRVVNFIYRRTRRWEEFRSLRHRGSRLKLLTLPYDSRLDNYRGMLLLLPADKEPILAFIRRHIERPDLESA